LQIPLGAYSAPHDYCLYLRGLLLKERGERGKEGKEGTKGEREKVEIKKMEGF